MVDFPSVWCIIQVLSKPSQENIAMAVGDIFRVVAEQSLHGQTVLNVFHYIVGAVGATDETTGLASKFVATVIPPLKAVQSNELSHVSVTVQKIFPLPVRVPYRNVNGVGAGTVAQNSLPTSMAVVGTKRTSFAGRKFRGRVFFAGVPVTHEDNSVLAAANIAAWQAVCDAVKTTLSDTGTDWNPVLFHKATNTSDLLTACEIRTVMRNQRRRQIGKGV